MTTREKWIVGIAIAVILVLAFRNQIGRLLGMADGSSGRNSNDATPQQMTVIQPIVVPVEPVHPPQPPVTCEQVANEIKGVKAKIAVTTNPQIKAQLQQHLAGLENQYAKMGCAGPPPPPSQQV